MAPVWQSAVVLCVCIVCTVIVGTDAMLGRRRRRTTTTRAARFPNGWYRAAQDDNIYGWTEFKDRGLYKPGMDEPTICQNSNHKRGTGSRKGSYYHYVICPTPDLNGTYTSCCGPTNREYCCNLDPLPVWAIILIIVVPLLCMCGCAAAAAYYLFVYLPQKSRAGAPLNQPPSYMGQSGFGQQGYPMQPGAPGAYGTPPAPGYGMPPPGSYQQQQQGFFF